ncbi:GcrA family cell cycle regulator [Roseinatronobacter bogoriensis]|uniref:GcrA cell cycle regulator n=1 Tax=Roseinatronobacter bogoriensis subsp. barguzinensis TaxID=441209 RepID=A0A2K8KDY6_9RHOB|nr:MULTISPECIES: GcrA family cell cycle regulator [Rhodobaca]ATX65945.1 GcrA cell cycle regulator [Rhodobaca barguzinensis]MBB4208074.1 GcrA cell cycle regulator [Rhodobaca bogoriensis DSM 18756]TDW38714.1 GcrA cell cycle regulator [Rhodobaca barguzinensis]TDY69248.1 GcrA cell cycle regulator [Rhodobaca bogoriensis DSM 18756]
MSWTDERVELLKKMWNEGHSASQIAKELGGVTRNAVIGKVHRLGLSNRNAPETEAKAEPKPVVTPDPKGAIEDVPPVQTPASPPPSAVKPAQPKPAVETPVVDLAKAKAERAAAAGTTSAPEEQEEDEPEVYTPRAIIPAGQPLPPQPSANEIDPEALATVREVEKTARKLSLLELTERTCKWPIGDPATEDFWFCGLPVKAGKPYCEAHVSVAFQPMSSRRDRKR